MITQEELYFDSLSTQLANILPPNGKVFFGATCSPEFIDLFTRRFNIRDSHITLGKGNKVPSGKYDLIVCSGQQIATSGDFATYSKCLNSGGIIASLVENRAYFQSQGTTSSDTLYANSNLDNDLSAYKLVPIFREPIGKFIKLNRLSSSHVLSRFLRKIGNKLPNSVFYSPYLCLIYKESKCFNSEPYISAMSLSSRVVRVRSRILYKIKNHKINDYIILVQRNFDRFIRFLKVITFIQHYDFIKRVIPSIPENKATDKKVLIIAMTYLQTGGVERVMLNIIKGINRDKFEIHILTTSFSSNPWHELFDKYVDKIIHVPSILDEHWTNHYRTRYIEEYILRNKADILFITNAETAYRTLPAVKNELSGLRVYDLLHTHGTPRDKDAYLRISMPYDKHINKRIVIDEYLKKYYVSKYSIDPAKVSVIYNGIDTQTLTSKNTSPDPILDRIPSDTKLVTYIGRLEFDKSPMRLVDIAIELQKRKAQVSLLVVGDGSLEESMIKKAAESNTLDRQIFFYGNSSDPLPIAKHSDYTLLVSNAEGIPMSVLESMSMSTPAIASAVGGIPEIINHEKDGFLVEILELKSEKEKVEAFTDAIINACQLNQDAYKNMQLNAVQKISTRFSHMPEIYEHLFEFDEVLTERRDTT